ncbi:MAG: branched-chain amino acid ABC transporter permease [Syntrophorhabdales bacterium]|jgi:branched-chain amino acid transport system permease protein
MDLGILIYQVFYGLTTGIAYVVFALGLTLMLGVMGILNVAHGEIYMISAMLYCSLIYYLGLNYFLSAILAIAFVCALGIVCSKIAVEPLLKSQNPLLAIILSTLAISMMLMNGSVLLWGATTVPAQLPLQGELHVGGLLIPKARVGLSGFGAAAVCLLYLFLEKTVMGKVVRATSQNRLAASLMGINLRRVYTFSFAIASVLAGLAGILIAPIWVSNPFMGQSMILKGFIVVIVGGLGNIRGAILIGLLLGLAEAFTGHFVSVYYRETMGYVLMILILIVKPKGLFAR